MRGYAGRTLLIAVGDAEVLLGALKERLDRPSVFLGPDEMRVRCVNLVGHKILDWILFVPLADDFLDDYDLLHFRLRNGANLHSKAVLLAVNLALFQLVFFVNVVDATHLMGELDLPVSLQHEDLIYTV